MAKSSSPSKRISDVVHERGPLTVAAFMELALYDPEIGYYARAARRSGRAGDFFTSVDVGSLFGQLLAVQIAEMAQILSEPHFDLVEAGAGDGRLAADILLELRRLDPPLYAHTRLHLVERSSPARAAQASAIANVDDRLASRSAGQLTDFDGVLLANELLDAMPVHQVIMRNEGLREVYVGVGRHSHALTTMEGALSTPALASYLERAGVALEPGWRAEIGLDAVAWIRDAARHLRRGFIMLIDYGHDARELYSAAHSQGTLTTFTRQTMTGSEMATPAWLLNPGEDDITSHVDFTSIQKEAESEGCVTLGFLDQTYFLLALSNLSNLSTLSNHGDLLKLKTLIMPGGLGSTMKVLILGKGVDPPQARRLFSMDARHMNTWAVVGLIVMIGSEAGTLAHIEPFWSWNTPIAWTGFIVFADSVVWRARGRSWIRSAPREFAALAAWSIPLWLVFEFYNRFIDNWHYVGLPENAVARYLGYAWSFATIWPAIFEGAELVGVWRGADAATERPGQRPSFRAPDKRAERPIVAVIGAAMLLWPLVWPSRFLAAPVWLGFILLLDPINARLGAESLTRDAYDGRFDRLKNLAGSGLLCGILWEMFNYWARAKWHYTVPILERYKLFEMPLPGYLGFPAFAVECFTMYVLLRTMLGRLFSRVRSQDAANTWRPVGL